MNKDRIFAYDIIKEENLKDIRSTGYLLRHKNRRKSHAYRE